MRTGSASTSRDSQANPGNRLLDQLRIKEADRLQVELQVWGGAVKFPANWYLAQEVRLANVGLSQGLQSLAKRAGVQLQVSEKLKSSRSKINGVYSGDLLPILEKLTLVHDLAVRVDAQAGVLMALTTGEDPPAGNAGFDPFSSIAKDKILQQELPKYHRALSLLQSGQVDAFVAFVDRLEPQTSSPQARQAFQAVIKAKQALENLQRKINAEASTQSRWAIDIRGYEPTADTMALGVSDESICPGRETVTEKIFVYQESPQDVLAFLQDYFKANPQAITEPETQPERMTKTDGAKPETGKTGLGDNNKPVEAGAKPPASTVAQQPPRSRDEVDAVDPCKSTASSGIKAIVDPTGIVMTGTLADVELAVRLMESLDIPRQQVFIEMYLVEVQKNWARTLETRLLRQDKVSAGVVSQLMSNTKAVAGIQATGTIRAASIDINTFINMVESNEVGRTISSPTLIAKNGEEAVISRIQTLRAEVDKAMPPTVVGGITTPALPNKVIERLEMPLALKVTPKINQHNRHVTLKFEYEETTAVTNPSNLAASSTTKNLIKTTLETAPGDVIVMAGLYTEKNSSLSQGLPGAVMLGAVSSLFGGKNSTSTSSSELLVFIRPTVLEPKAGTVLRNTLH